MRVDRLQVQLACDQEGDGLDGGQKREAARAIKKSSRQDDGLLNFATGLPWWLGIVLAGLSAAVLHWLAAIPPVEPVNGIPTPSYTLRMLVGGLAGVGQLLLPVVLLVGAGLSAWAGNRRQASRQTVPREQDRRTDRSDTGEPSPSSAEVHCPVCRSAMVRRRAKAGPHEGALRGDIPETTGLTFEDAGLAGLEP